jgi:2-isopropylmalate synthase
VIYKKWSAIKLLYLFTSISRKYTVRWVADMEKGPWLTDKWWTTPHNYADEIRNQFTIPEKVYVNEMTLREAEQSPGVTFKRDEKIRIAQALDELGVQFLELTWPVVSRDDEEIAKELVKIRPNAKLIVVSRMRKEDIDLALKCDVDGVVIGAPVGNPWVAKVYLGLDEKDAIEQLVNIVIYAKAHGLFTKVRPWDNSRAPLEYLKRLYTALVNEGHADHITLSDTYGMLLPWTTTWLISKLRAWVPKTPIEMHVHNDFGLATAIMIAAVCGGASVVHTCMNTLGERAGNASTEEVVMALELLLSVKTGIKLDKIYETSKLIADLAKVVIPPNKPIVGAWLHQYWSGMIISYLERSKAAGRPTASMPFLPDLIGKPSPSYVLGKMSGGFVVEMMLKDMGMSATEEQIDRIVELVKEEGIIRKGIVPNYEFKRILRRVL